MWVVGLGCGPEFGRMWLADSLQRTLCANPTPGAMLSRAARPRCGHGLHSDSSSHPDLTRHYLDDSEFYFLSFPGEGRKTLASYWASESLVAVWPTAEHIGALTITLRAPCSIPILSMRKLKHRVIK